jgi:hypothetical protein
MNERNVRFWHKADIGGSHFCGNPARLHSVIKVAPRHACIEAKRQEGETSED